jgi:hypothetical protein
MSSRGRRTLAVLLTVALTAGFGSVATPARAAVVLYEAESAQITQGLVESNHAGFTGAGFVNYNNAVGSAVEFTVTSAVAETTPLTFRFANGTTVNRPMDIAVNGATVATGVVFGGTGAWTTWSTYTANLALIAGTNRVRATATTANGGPNLDSLAVGSAPGDAPIKNPLPDPALSGLGLTLTQLATFPQSNPVPAPIDDRLRRWARINYLVEAPDGSGRQFVPDLNGNLYTMRAGAAPTAYLDVRARIGANFFSGRGLGSGLAFVAFDPNFATNGRFYTTHTEALGALTSQRPDWTQPSAIIHSVVSEWTATNPAANTFTGTRRTLLRIGFASYLHAIQQVDFNPTARPGSPDYGLLYLAVGDGGTGFQNSDPQNMRLPHGKILRIDPRGTNGVNGNYGIPASNPFVGRPNTLGEVYALGMRDPHRFSWDTGEGNRMFLGSIGEHDIESVYDVRAGDNFGWSEREGPFVFKKSDRCDLYPLQPNDGTFGYTYPVAAYDHNPPAGTPCTADVGRAIVGGFVYRGNALPALRGKYVFGDLVRGNIYFTDAAIMRRGGPLAPIQELRIFNTAGTRVTMQTLAGDTRVDLRFGTDRAGELYVLAKANGRIWKVTGTSGSAVAGSAGAAAASSAVHPSLEPNVVAHYDFEHPVSGNAAQEADQGPSGTKLNLVNGGAAMRVAGDGAHQGSTGSLQTKQVSPTRKGNDDWKAGNYVSDGVSSLSRFNRVQGITVMGWFKMAGQNPSPNSNTSTPSDSYGAIGLAGVLTADSNGHPARALLEVEQVDGTLRVVASGRRIDGGERQYLAARQDWRTLLPPNQWVFLAGTFDYNKGTIALYRNGQPLDASYVVPGDPWGVAGPGPHYTSATNPRGLKIGGSYPQDNNETNPCACRMDSLMFLDRAVTADEVRLQYQHVTATPMLACGAGDTTVGNVMGASNWRPLTPSRWQFPGTAVIQAQRGVARPGPRRPQEYAVLSAGPRFGSVEIRGEVRIDVPVAIAERDVILMFGYRSDTQFYYVHLSSDNTIYPHNGIFVVNNADRLRIDQQWNGSRGAPPAIRDLAWHQVRVSYCADTGQIAVYLDGASTPLMTATDPTFRSGRIGFGSFDNVGRLRNLTVTGTAAP